MLNWIKALAVPFEIVGDTVRGWTDRKKLETEGKLKIVQAKTEAAIHQIHTNDNYDFRLEELSLESRGWKDEYLLLITTAPLVLVFFPSMVPTINAGFMELSALPEWYLYALAAVYIDTFGFRRAIRSWIERGSKK